MKEDIAQILKRTNLKTTKSRMAILEIFSEGCDPQSAEGVFTMLKRNTTDLVTVYRTLGTFLKKGIIKQVDLRKNAAYYELNNHHHHHIVCTTCGIIEEFEMCGVDKLSKNVLQSSTKFNIVNQHSLELFGVCKSCRKG